MHNNVNLISETHKDITMGNLQIPQFQPPHSALTDTSPRKAFKYLQIIYIVRN